ncbi:hypothetical protein FORC20_0917 [Salmonella enterica subsp. enterica serovar Typhimurium]|nr:hypothetical protein FORC20_0917 [Salmonella enterica subsp. enterica serovar Typhimurium]
MQSPHATGQTGLSPLARGTRRMTGGWFSCVRFIPAGAGNTMSNTPALA